MSLFRKAPSRSVGNLRAGSQFEARSAEPDREAEVAELGRALVLNSPDCIEILTPDGFWEFVNPAGRHGLGIDDVQTVVGQHWSILFAPEFRPAAAEAVLKARAGEVARFQAETVTGDGARRWWDILVTPVRGPDGKIQRLIGSSRDIGALKQVETSLNAALSAAEAASRAKDDFLANLSHELRTPLTSILGFAELVAGGGRLHQDDALRLDRIERAGRSLLALLNDMLDLARAGAGTLRIEPAPCDLPGLMGHVADLVAPLAAGKPIDLTVEMDADLAGWLELDADRVQQVVLNLVGNAVKFTEAGQVTVAVRRELAYGDEHLRFSVDDTGPGVPPEVLPTLFDRFTQVDSSRKRKHGGAGLGLAICKELVTRMGGEVGAESRLGHGSTFWFRVPLKRVAAPAAPVLDDEVGAGGALRVLVADDNEANQTLLGAVLAAGGHEVCIVGDGAAALQALADAPFDVVLMDIQMPIVDGLTAIATLRRAGHANADTPVIAITANVFPEQVAGYIAAGATDCIGKPFKALEVLTKVAKWGAATAVAA